MEIIEYLETYDLILSILDTVKFGCRSLTTKDRLMQALNEMTDVCAGFMEIRTIRFNLDALLFSVKSLSDVPEGTVTDEVKFYITEGIRAVQRSIAVAFYTEYYEKDLGEFSEDCPELLRKIVADVLLGDYRLGESAA